jgi:hypothetical protein
MSQRRYHSKTQARIAEAWKAIANTSDGQLVIADLMVWCNAYQPIESNDPIEMARHVGENNVVKRVAGFLGYKPETFAQQAEDDTDFLNRMMESMAGQRAPH